MGCTDPAEEITKSLCWLEAARKLRYNNGANSIMPFCPRLDKSICGLCLFDRDLRENVKEDTVIVEAVHKNSAPWDHFVVQLVDIICVRRPYCRDNRRTSALGNGSQELTKRVIIKRQS